MSQSVFASDQAAPNQAAIQVLSALQSANIAFRSIHHADYPQAIRSPQDFAQALGYELARISKTLFVKFREVEQFCFLVCGADKRVDLRAIASLVQAKRLEMAKVEDLQRLVGYPPSSVTPIGIAGIAVYLDEGLLQFPSILTGSGTPAIEIELAPQDLQRLCAAQVLKM